MKALKKFLVLTLALALCLSLFACGSADSAGSSASSSTAGAEPAADPTEAPTPEPSKEPTPEPEPVDDATTRISSLSGPTGMGMAQIFTSGNTAYQCTVAASADEITPLLVQGDLDIAAVPANLASVLYNNTEGKVQVLAVNTLGVLYIVENGENINSVEDLRGKTIYSAGKGSTPEYALNYMLSQNGIDPAADVTIEWKSEHAECVSALAAQEGAIAMLPQPFVTTALMKNEGFRVCLDLTEEWEKLSSTEGSPATLITGVAVVRTAFAQEHPTLVSKFLEDYKASVDYVNNDPESASADIESLGIVPAAVARKAIPDCHIVCITGEEMKTALSGYLQTLFDQNPKAVGGSLPGDDFYCLG